MSSARERRGVVVALLLVLAGCGDDGTTPGEGGRVESVVVTGVPATTLLVGDSARLVATAVNATGGVVSNQKVTWKSSAPSVAAVSGNGMVRALGAGEAVITAAVAGREGSASVAVADGGTIGTQGGTLTAAGGAVRLVIPGGALAQATLLLVHPAANAPADPRVVPSTAYEIGPDGVVFARGVTLTMSFDRAKLPSGTAGESLQLYAQSGPGWAVVRGSTVDLATNTVTGVVGRVGVYSVRSTAVDRIVLRGASVGGALFAGQTAQLGVTLLAASGDTLPSRPIAWASSDPGKVSVDATGKLTAVATGQATVTAATDGKSAGTSITVLARPTPDWSSAADWTTYQANAQHTGYVDATVDPTVFRERWSVTPDPAVQYYPPTTGGGRLFLATSSYFGAQRLLALNPADGSQRWVRDFGPIFGINQPTYHNGTVYITSGGHEDTYIWALNDSDGTLRFQTAFGSQWEHWKAPVVAGSTIVTAGGYYGGMYGFDLATGKQTFFRSGPQVDGWAPVAADGLVYVTSGGVTAVNPLDGKVVAQLSDGRLPSVTTPVIGSLKNLLTIDGNRLISVDLPSMKVSWEQSGGYVGMPVVGGGVVYGITGTGVTARRESDGTQLWIWTAPGGTKPAQTMVLTRNVLFVSTSGGYGSPGSTYAVDLASHLTVWSYPLDGALAMSKDGILYIVQGPKVVAIDVR